MRVAIIGARRVSGGTGPFLGRFVAEAGAELAAVLGTSPETAEAAAQALGEATGTRPAAFTDIDVLIEAVTPEAIVIASPTRTHETYLERALQARVHVLCEKPLLWNYDDPAGRAAEFAEGFRTAGRVLRVNAQWPFTLPSYRELHPDVPRAPARFEMRMAPAAQGLDILFECLPHPLSLLATVTGDPSAEIRRPDVRPIEDGWDVRFDYAARSGSIGCRVVLEHCAAQPRPAAYGFDGRMAHRRVELEPYRFFLEGAGRAIPLPDPTPLLVRSFLAEAASSAPAEIDLAAVPGVAHLVRLVRAATEASGPPSP